MYTCVCIHTRMYTHTYIRIYTQRYVYIYIYIKKEVTVPLPQFNSYSPTIYIMKLTNQLVILDIKTSIHPEKTEEEF